MKVSTCSLITGLAVGAAMAGTAQGAVLEFTDAEFSAVNSSDRIRNTSNITSYTTSAGSVNTLAGAATVTSVTGGTDLSRNFWGRDGSEKDGAASLVGLDVSTGAININVADFEFGVVLGDAGATGDGNDLFIVDIQNKAGATVRPLDVNGNLIGDFVLSLTSGNFGTESPVRLDWNLNGSAASPLNDVGSTATVSINGVGFDLSDFTGTGTLTGVAGLRIDGGGSLDPAVVGFNTQAVPEPGSMALIGLGLTLMLSRRR